MRTVHPVKAPAYWERVLSGLRLIAGVRGAAAEGSAILDEMRFHVDMQTEKNLAAGMTPDEAHRAARIAFGGVEQWREEARDQTRSGWIDGVVRDTRFAARSLRAHPGFAFATIATLALAIAAATTAFSFIDSIFLRPLPVPSADRLVHVYLPRPNGRNTVVGTGGAALLRAHRDIFDAVAASDSRNVKFMFARGSLDQRYVSFVSADFFPMLGLTPRLGRFFSTSEDAVPGRDPVAVISAALWKDRFASDPHIVGEHIRIAGQDFTISGVGPEGFDGVGVGETPSQVWLPTMMMGVVNGGCSLHPPCTDSDVLARLAPGVTLAAAQAEVATLDRQLSQLAIGDDSVRHAKVIPATGVVIQKQNAYRPLARLLSAIAAVLLLIACANLAGLLLARGVSREREIALRLALGASRRRIARQFFIDSLLIGIAGGGCGVVLSFWTARGLMGFFATDEEGFPHFFNIGLDGRVLGFAVLASLAATLLFGVLPAWTAARADAADVLKNSGGGAPRGRMRFGLIATQIALTSALLSGAALLSRSFIHLLHSQRFDPSHVAVFRVRPVAAQFAPARAQRYVRAVLDRVSALPTVESAALARGAGLIWSQTPARAGIGATPSDSTLDVETHSVSPRFFSTLHIPVDRGREFTEADGPGAPLVTILAMSVAHRLWPDGDALGRVAYVHGQPFRVVGVVPDYQIRMAGDPAPFMIFVPFWQNALGPEADARFAVRVRGDAAAALPELRRVATDVDHGVPVAEVMTMAAQVDANYPEIHLGQTVFVVAGSLALFLSAIGLYGTVAYLVARRTREIGIRIALGAAPRRVVLSFVRQGLGATAAGLVVGLVSALFGSRLLGAWLVGVPAHDAIAFAAAALAVLAAATIACGLPAARAARVDPVTALRAE